MAQAGGLELCDRCGFGLCIRPDVLNDLLIRPLLLMAETDIWETWRGMVLAFADGPYGLDGVPCLCCYPRQKLVDGKRGEMGTGLLLMGSMA